MRRIVLISMPRHVAPEYSPKRFKPRHQPAVRLAYHCFLGKRFELGEPLAVSEASPGSLRLRLGSLDRRRQPPTGQMPRVWAGEDSYKRAIERS